MSVRTIRPFLTRAARIALATALCLAPSGAAAAPGAPPLVRVTRIDGSVLDAEAVRLDRGAKALAVRLAAGREEQVPLDTVVSLQFAGRSTAKEAAEPGTLSLEFTNGDVVFGQPTGGNGETIETISPLLGKKAFSIELLSRVLVAGNLDRRDRPEHFARTGNEDTAWVKVSRGRDVVTGTLEKFDKEKVVIDTGKTLGQMAFDWSELVALALVVTDPPKPKSDFRAIVFGADGSRLEGELREISADGVDLEWTLGGEFRLPARRVESIGFVSPKFAYLSDLAPVRVVEYPYVGDASDVLFPFQRDRSVDGNRISIGDSGYSKGLGVHSYCELVYDLGGSFARFASDVGIDDEVRAIEARGSVVFRVIVDGAVAWESPVLRGGEKAVRVPAVDLRGKRELRLVVDFADESDSGDRADWAGAFLAR